MQIHLQNSIVIVIVIVIVGTERLASRPLAPSLIFWGWTSWPTTLTVLTAAIFYIGTPSNTPCWLPTGTSRLTKSCGASAGTANRNMAMPTEQGVREGASIDFILTPTWVILPKGLDAFYQHLYKFSEVGTLS